ncbi:hypothetical protein [Streptomyces sp. DG1A-41]|uniref:hypothetical protein n=1 Tax=Streptomyces sp. DG1A-41 TaxID=3125779 RepID=UPI0030D07468
MGDGPARHGLHFRADLHLASQLMYYGDDAVEIVLALLLASQWYRAQGRSLRTRRGTRQPAPA